jgi:hypothetical protein
MIFAILLCGALVSVETVLGTSAGGTDSYFKPIEIPDRIDCAAN